MKINDSRKIFTNTFSNYKKQHAIKELINNIYYQKKDESFFWTAEFTELNSFILNPRRAEIERLNGLDWKLSLQVSLQGRVSVIFKSDADSELTNFLNLAKMRMSNWKAKFCKYKNKYRSGIDCLKQKI